MTTPTKLENVLARLREKAQASRARLEAAAGAGDPKARQILRELDGEAVEVQVDPKPPPAAQVPLHWSERAQEREPGEEG
jgi:hypothetical protein